MVDNIIIETHRI